MSPSPRSAGLARVEGLLQILVCPACRSRLVVDVQSSELVCTNRECGRAYPVTPDGIPVLLIDESRETLDVAPSTLGSLGRRTTS